MQTCKYHKNEIASWYCPGCDINFCMKCVPGGEENFGYIGPKCYGCNQTLQYLGDGEEKPPFWNVSSRFFTFPFSPAFFIALVTVLALGILASQLFFLFALVVFVFAASVYVKYGLVSLQVVASGKWEAPEIGEVLSGAQGLFVKQMAVYFTIGAIGYFLANYSITASNFWLGFANVAMPASIMVLVMTESVGQAVNPLFLISLMFRIGWTYLLLFFTFSMVISAPSVVIEILPEEGNFAPVLILLFVLSFYFNTVVHAMMGYVLYCHAAKLGLLDYQEMGVNLNHQEYERKKALGKSFFHLQENNISEARKTVNVALKEFPEDIALHDRMHKILMLLKDERAVANHCADFCSLLVKQKNAGKAVIVYLDSLRLITPIQINDNTASLEMASILFSQNKHKVALYLLKNNSETPTSNAFQYQKKCILMAKILAEGLSNFDLAKQVIQRLKSEGFNNQDVTDYEKIIEEVASASGKPA